MDFLSEIIAAKRRRLAEAKTRVTHEDVFARGRRMRTPDRAHCFADALRRYGKINIIAEFKRRSPSKGDIRPGADAMAITRSYEAAGAAAVSVLTEEDYFDGSLDDLHRIREAISLPLLRKDFIFDEYQVYESAAAGADALLLIAAALDDDTLSKLREITENELWMDALVEVHTRQELERALSCGATLIGVNNRDLRTFDVSTATSVELARLVPPETTLVSESGLNTETVRELRTAGYDGFLVGEALMRAENPGMALHGLIVGASKADPSVKVKICGITNLEDAKGAIEAGADMLGFNFCPQSPRFIEPQAVRDIVFFKLRLRREVRMIGVFVNETLERIQAVAEEAHLSGIQLHGDETVEFCRQLKELAPDRFVIKSFPTNGALNLEQVSHYPTDAILLDASDAKLRGGTGKLADWSIAQAAAEKLPRVLLAGGLSVENVADAIATVRPYAVDACSALELSPGKKDHARVKEFVAAVRAVKLPDETSVA
ncbi:MAG TPA: indole-3-glycerol phosphate synthase TrpC [Pyrinomonadaceae bacterium]|nr:indole-3-glycerol phosphate synthase TrpC [Pyrinomonadaceae bacterium]